MVAEQRVAVDVVEVAVLGRRTAGAERLHRAGVQAEERVQPRLDRVTGPVADRTLPERPGNTRDREAGVGGYRVRELRAGCMGVIGVRRDVLDGDRKRRVRVTVGFLQQVRLNIKISLKKYG